MPLHGYLSIKDPGRISTITSLPGVDKHRRKKIELLVPGRLSSSQSMYVRILVRDCISHEPRGAVVPVELFKRKIPAGWQPLGTAKCCPLCWRIVVPPDGVSLAAPLTQPPVAEISEKQERALRKGRAARAAKKRPDKSSIRQHIMTWMENEDFTLQDIMEVAKVSKTSVIRNVRQMIDEGVVVVVKQGAAGPGNQTWYGKAP